MRLDCVRLCQARLGQVRLGRLGYTLFYVAIYSVYIKVILASNPTLPTQPKPTQPDLRGILF